MHYTPNDKSVAFLDFDEISVADTAELEHLITQKDIETFASLTGDFNPLHLDKEFAKKTLFHKPVVHGMLSASFISTIIGMLMPGGGALWMSQTLEFLQPAYVGDMLHVLAKVKQKSLSTRVLVLEISITNQRGKKLISGDSKVRMPKLKPEEKAVEIDKTKTVLITGGARGIGAATARKLAQSGYAVVINYIHSAAEANQLVDEIIRNDGRALAVCVDISDEQQVKTLFSAAEEQFGPIREIVHCAASGSALKSFETLNWNEIQQQLAVQLKGAYNCMREALPKMVEEKYGSIVFIGSIAVDDTPPAQQMDYIIAKSALTSFARCLAVEYGAKGVRINVVAPGMTQTDMISELPDKAKMVTQMQTPLRRIAAPEDIANTISFLLSPEAGHITGETIRVCGGLTML
jgi:3-oxoacyl-[acyl-carrier protein] reductase